MSDRHITINIEVVDEDNAAAVLQTARVSVTVPPLAEPEPPVPSKWEVVIESGDTGHVLDQTMGQDLGTFHEGVANIHQQCFVIYLNGLDLVVFFRPEDDGSRQEIVFERSKCFLGDGVASDIGPYTARIFEGGELRAKIDVPHHYAFTRWRWQSAPRPIVIESMDTLIKSELIPPYIRSTTRAPEAVLVPYEIMGLAGIYPHMGDAGERPDIGLLTDPQAEFVVTGSTSSRDVVFAQAEASGSIPWHMRDENTGAPISFEIYPKACWYYGQQGSPQVIVPAHPTVIVDAAHQPALNYLPYLLTRDPYYLEGMQFQATWNYGSLSLGYRPTLSQTRQFAWDMRTLGQCAAITPEATPSWLQPQPYWRRMLERHCDFFETQYMESTSRLQTYFRATDNVNGRKADGKFPEGTWCQPWQSEFLGCVFGWLVDLGHEDWRAAFEWVTQGTLDRTSGDGWPRALCTPYQMMLQREKNGDPAYSYIEAWEINQEIAGLTYEDEDTWEQDDMTYLTYTHGALIYCDKHTPGSGDANLAWVNEQFAERQYEIAFKWSIGLAGHTRDYC